MKKSFIAVMTFLFLGIAFPAYAVGESPESPVIVTDKSLVPEGTKPIESAKACDLEYRWTDVPTFEERRYYKKQARTSTKVYTPGTDAVDGTIEKKWEKHTHKWVPPVEGVKECEYTKTISTYTTKHQFQKWHRYKNNGEWGDWIKHGATRWEDENFGDSGFFDENHEYEYRKTGETDTVKTGETTETMWFVDNPGGDWKATGECRWKVEPKDGYYTELKWSATVWFPEGVNPNDTADDLTKYYSTNGKRTVGAVDATPGTWSDWPDWSDVGEFIPNLPDDDIGWDGAEPVVPEPKPGSESMDDVTWKQTRTVYWTSDGPVHNKDDAEWTSKDIPWVEWAALDTRQSDGKPVHYLYVEQRDCEPTDEPDAEPVPTPDEPTKNPDKSVDTPVDDGVGSKSKVSKTVDALPNTGNDVNLWLIAFALLAFVGGIAALTFARWHDSKN